MQETYKKEIKEVIWERYRKRPGTKEALSVYQQVVIMVGWKQEDSDISYHGDFKDGIANGDKFQGVHKISTAWDEYIGTHFEPEGEQNMDDADSGEESNPKKKPKWKRPDPTI
ncbi:hypothetical protein PAXRUDRAFT_16884 [Paxillus rubicundulus Ve08.2h10]|uniref:Unplaced genomic scaffold scaffold_1773, whole genome shotgun sequence n=1 Tax=Paxillus rubicundulus Ve08.2h10 TaxID=930991 RepID=A0A0D0CSU8_9AGAM|nr:hypothetical protein PAXRUDRAFT_16884 [Paxillus rubicundulus Ve08.2h10]